MGTRIGISIFFMFCGMLIGTLPSFGQEDTATSGDKDNSRLEERIIQLEKTIEDLKEQLKYAENADKLDLLTKHAAALTEQAKAVNELVQTDRKRLADELKVEVDGWLKRRIDGILILAGLLAALGIPTLSSTWDSYINRFLGEMGTEETH